MMLLSVIIPVYNVVGTLRRCVDSVIAQDVDDMEIIIVDDGSTDGSAVICDEYKSLGILVVHQTNAGLSEARNVGIGLAQGKFVTFVDSDDYIEQDAYSLLLRQIQSDDADILEYSLVRDGGRGHASRMVFPDHTYTNMVDYWLDAQAYAHTYACNKIYKRQLFNNVCFPKGKKFEDVPTLWNLLKGARKVVTTSMGFYHYTINPSGISARAGGAEYRDLLEAHLAVLSSKRLTVSQGLKEYYRHVLDIQLQTYIYTGNVADIKLPTMRFLGSLKLLALNILGMRGLCRIIRAIKVYL